MNKKIYKLDSNSVKQAHWWEKQKKDWAIEDKEGNWWIIPGSEFPEQKINTTKKGVKLKRRKESSIILTKPHMWLIIVCAVLGVSLALNLVYYLLR